MIYGKGVKGKISNCQAVFTQVSGSLPNQIFGFLTEICFCHYAGGWMPKSWVS